MSFCTGTVYPRITCSQSPGSSASSSAMEDSEKIVTTLSLHPSSAPQTPENKISDVISIETYLLTIIGRFQETSPEIFSEYVFQINCVAEIQPKKVFKILNKFFKFILIRVQVLRQSITAEPALTTGEKIEKKNTYYSFSLVF